MNKNHGGILSGFEIEKKIRSGAISIDPFDPALINSASIDLRLGSAVAVYEDVVGVDLDGTIPGERFHAKTGTRARLSVAKKHTVRKFEIDSRGFLILPGIGYLMHTAERIKTDHYVPIIDGKSSTGRLFVAAHVTAGYGDPGYDGQYTLEVVAVHPVVIYPGMRFCQMRFHTFIGDVESYERKGNYRGDLAEGPVPSMSWKMFDDKKKPGAGPA